MRFPDHLETARLVMRPPRLADARAIFDGYAQDPEVTRWLIWRPHESIADTKAFLRRCLAARRADASLPFILTHRGSDQPIGMIEARPKGFKAELGYVLRRSEWGQGLMPEAVRAVVAVLLADPEIFRAWAVCDVENVPSARVLEKAGLEREGLLRRYTRLQNVAPDPRDVYCYARCR